MCGLEGIHGGWMDRDWMRKVKGWIEKNLAGDVKNNKRFYRYTGHKTQVMGNAPPLINEKEDLSATD